MRESYLLNTALALCLLVTAASCNSGSQGSSQPVVRGILGFDEPAAVSANAHIRGSAQATPNACGAVGTDRAFGKELMSHADDPKVPYEWAPIVSGPNGRTPTIQQPESYASGSITVWYPPASDFMFSHPFGLDYSLDFALDPAFLDLNYVPAGTGNNWPLHAEIEQGLFPYDEFGYGVPQVSDRVIMKGAWIMDCGHSDNYGQPTLTNNYGAEIHPPSFLAFARQLNATSTLSLAFVNPYRESQLYNSNVALVNDLGNYKRFTDPNTKTFPQLVRDELFDAAAHGRTDALDAHVLVEPTDFGNVSWYVCAPAPRPTGAILQYTYRFTMRSGIGLQAVVHGDIGCVQFIAVSGGAYMPMPIQRSSVTWPWSEINVELGADVQGKIFDKVGDPAHCCNVAVKKDPIRDSYPMLHPRSGDRTYAPTAFNSSADDQPFPFYGLAHVYWWNVPSAIGVTNTPAQHADPTFNPNPLEWTPGSPQQRALTVTLVSPKTGTATVTFAADPPKITGPDASSFTIVANTCQGSVLRAESGPGTVSSSCTITLSYRPTHVGQHTATLLISDAVGDNPWTVPLVGYGLIG